MRTAIVLGFLICLVGVGDQPARAETADSILANAKNKPKGPPPGSIAGTGQTPSTTATFQGTWLTQTNVGGRFNLVLNLRAKAAQGAFTDMNGNPQYNGTLTGQVTGNRLDYTWVQPVTGSKGGGYFILSATGREITGRLTVDGDPKSYEWSGTVKDTLVVN